MDLTKHFTSAFTISDLCFSPVASPSRHLRRATIGTVWPAHGLTRHLSARSTRCRTLLRRLRRMLSLVPTATNCQDRQKRRALPRLKNRESGQLSLRCSPRIIILASAARTYAKQSALTQKTGNGLTPRPSVCAPGYVAAHVALAALRPTLRQMVEESA